MVIHFSPSNSRTLPERTKNASDMALWKWALGPPASGPMSTRYRPYSPSVEVFLDR